MATRNASGRRSTGIVVEPLPGFGCGWSLKGSLGFGRFSSLMIED